MVTKAVADRRGKTLKYTAYRMSGEVFGATKCAVMKFNMKTSPAFPVQWTGGRPQWNEALD